MLISTLPNRMSTCGYCLWSKSLICGGARLDGRTNVEDGADCASWCSIQAMTRIAPPQPEQVSISRPNTRLSRRAPVIGARRSACVGALRSRALPTGRLCLSWTAVGGHGICCWARRTVEARAVDSRCQYQGGQSGNEIERLEDDVSRAVTVRGLQFVTHVTMRVSDKRFCEMAGRLMHRHNRSSLASLMHANPDTSVQGQTPDLSAPVKRRLCTIGQRLSCEHLATLVGPDSNAVGYRRAKQLFHGIGLGLIACPLLLAPRMHTDKHRSLQPYCNRGRPARPSCPGRRTVWQPPDSSPLR